MDAIKNLLSRKSSKNLEAPFPSKKEMDIVYQSALRAPDHAWLRPSKFLEFKGESLEELSKIFTNFANDHYKEDKAFIEKAKDKEVTEQELIDFCRETLAGFKIPKKIDFCDLPKTSTGKIQKFELRKKAKELS